MAISEIIASVLLIIATLLVVATVVSLWRAPDALTRANLLGPTVGLAVPLIIVAKLVVDFGRWLFAVAAHPGTDRLLRCMDHRLGRFLLSGPLHLWRNRHRRQARQAHQ